MQERHLEALLMREVKAAGGMAFKIAPTHVGAPDRVIALPGARLVFVELKTDTGRLSPAQVALHAKVLRMTGNEVVVLRGADEVRAFFRG